jgi:hypothetical protein
MGSSYHQFCPVAKAMERSGAVTRHGPETLRRAMPRWFTLSVFAPVSRPAVSR